MFETVITNMYQFATDYKTGVVYSKNGKYYLNFFDDVHFKVLSCPVTEKCYNALLALNGAPIKLIGSINFKYNSFQLVRIYDKNDKIVFDAI